MGPSVSETSPSYELTHALSPDQHTTSGIFVHQREVVALADRRAKMAQDRVNGRDVEEEIWDDEVADVVVSAEPAPHNARVQLERVRLRAGEVIWLQPLQKAAPLRQSPLERRVHHGRRTRRWALALEELCHVRIHFVAAHAELLTKRKHIPLINQATRSDPLI
jgi:hypothetical protein